MLQTLLDAVGPDGDAEGGAEGMVELLLGTLELHNASELPRPSLLRVARRALEAQKLDVSRMDKVLELFG